MTANEGAALELTAVDGQFQVLEALSDTTLIRVCGYWGDETGGCGVFTLDNGDHPPRSLFRDDAQGTKASRPFVELYARWEQT